MNKTHQLILSLTSPYARRVRIAALENQIPFDITVDVPWNEDTKVTSLNPAGKVPVWVTPDQEVFYDSRVIVEFLEITGGYKFSSPDPIQYLQIKKIEALAEGVMDASLYLFAERKKRPLELQHPWWIERQFAKVHRGLKALQSLVGNNQYLYENRFTTADMALISALGYVQLRFNEDFHLEDQYPQLGHYYLNQMKRESVAATVPVL